MTLASDWISILWIFVVFQFLLDGCQFVVVVAGGLGVVGEDGGRGMSDDVGSAGVNSRSAWSARRDAMRPPAVR